ncbi:MAG: S9 family peptidase [Candidatus Solibacter usitatus]|nr:S9 family peptidase [Candidatus Solibacter usitatus]
MSALHPPRAKIVPRQITQHGETRIDNYFWLRDRDDPDTIAYLEAENAYTEEVMAPAKALEDELYQEMLGRILQTDTSAPVRRGDWLYYSRTEEGCQYAVYCRKRGSMDAPEEILLDCNALARDVPYLRLGNFAVSPDQSLLAYSLDLSGDEIYTLFIRNLETGELLADRIPNTYYGLAWLNDNRTLVYITLDDALRPCRAHLHRLGVTEDTLLLEEPDERFHLTLHKSRSRRFVFLQLDSAASSEVHYIDADSAAAPHLLYARNDNVEYDVEHHGDHFYIRTTEGGRNYRVVTAPIADPRRENWVEWLPHRANVMVESVEPFANHIVVEERENGLRRLRICAMDGVEHTVEMPEPAYTLSIGDNPEFHTAAVRFTYTSLVTPPAVYDYDMAARRRTLVKQMPVLGGYEPEQFETLRLHAPSHDGALVPISLVWRKGALRNGANPLLLYGYGSYGISIDAAFVSDRLSLLERGFIYAIAHIRGGEDLGKPWHDAGKLEHKKNTFFDFIAAAEFLIREGYTSPSRLAILGGSAGGLLMGAVINMRPELFHAVIAKVPFVDVLNTATDPTLPLTVIEYDEWGNSNEKPFWELIRSYSPYDNIQPKPYPNMLVTAGLNDPRVSYWEPAKWVAKLRALKTSDNLLLLRTNLAAGHGGASGRYDKLRETAQDYAFLLKASM